MAKTRGRPSVSEKFYGDSHATMDKIWEGQNYRSKRSVADMVYCTMALEVITEAASEIENIESIFDKKNQKIARSILSQIGRALAQDGYSEGDAVELAKIACLLKKNSWTTKAVENKLRDLRMGREF